MTRRFWPIVCATGLTVSLIGTIANDGHAQRGAERGRRAAGSAGGGFSREGPAASGGGTALALLPPTTELCGGPIIKPPQRWSKWRPVFCSSSRQSS